MKIKEWLEEGIIYDNIALVDIVDKLAKCVGMDMYLFNPSRNQHQEVIRASVVISLAVNKYGLDFDTEDLHYNNEKKGWILKGCKDEN